MAQLFGNFYDNTKVQYFYIIRNTNYNELLYIGVSSNLYRRIEEHNSGKSHYTSKFGYWALVYFEVYENDVDAFARERQVKKWGKRKKLALIDGRFDELKSLSRFSGNNKNKK